MTYDDSQLARVARLVARWQQHPRLSIVMGTKRVVRLAYQKSAFQEIKIGTESSDDIRFVSTKSCVVAAATAIVVGA